MSGSAFLRFPTDLITSAMRLFSPSRATPSLRIFSSSISYVSTRSRRYVISSSISWLAPLSVEVGLSLPLFWSTLAAAAAVPSSFSFMSLSRSRMFLRKVRACFSIMTRPALSSTFSEIISLTPSSDRSLRA